MSAVRTTIFALSSAPGRAAVAVFRVSGPAAGELLDRLASPRPKPRAAALRRVRAPGEVEPFDEALVLWLPGPRSETGEDMAELHVHGGRAVAAAATAALVAAGAIPARPGEFARRAFEAGRLDLTQAEAVADLVDAETEGQRRQAMRQMQGALGASYDRWRSALLDVIARVEVVIDFPDEGDVAAAAGRGLAAETAALLDRLAAEMDSHLADAHRGERVRDGFHVAILGATNVGKSSLLNRLARRDAAIVADVPGTTRDVVEVHLGLVGQLVVLADTAGLAEAGRGRKDMIGDAIEAEGVRRALARAADADLRLGVVDAERPETVMALTGLLRGGDLIWINKTDAAAPDAAESMIRSPIQRFHVEPPIEALAGSAVSAAGIESLEAALASRVAALAGSTEAAPLTRVRHRLAVERAREALRRARPRLADAAELAAEDLRLAARALGEITGRVDVEEILDRVFAGFCIGK
jgi:tRNA modification GTPase